MVAKKAWIAGLGGGALLIVCSLLHRGPAEPARPRRPAPRAEPELREAPAPRPAARESSGFWESVDVLLQTKTGSGPADLRQSVIDRTAEELGWDGSRRNALASASDAAVREVEAAWSIREAQIATLPLEHAPEIQADYENRKRTALGRIEAMLEPSREPERLLLERLDEWFDAIR